MNREDLEGELERLHRASYAWALGCCRRDPEEAEEVLQETYLKFLDGRARFGGESSFKTFLFGVIRRTAAEHRRRSWLRRLRLESVSRSEVERPLVANGVEGNHSRLHRALADLSARQRELLELVFGQDLTIEEAARTIGISVGSARVHYERGKKRLRQALGEERP